MNTGGWLVANTLVTVLVAVTVVVLVVSWRGCVERIGQGAPRNLGEQVVVYSILAANPLIVAGLVFLVFRLWGVR